MLESKVVSGQIGPNLSRQLLPGPSGQGATLLAWYPRERPLRIEYSSSLLCEVRAAGKRADAFGLLFGVRRGPTIRLLATHTQEGLEPLGAFASRLRSEVFLTEEDLQRFDNVPACAMLVISGESVGFFARDTIGTIADVCSYREVAGPESIRPAEFPKVVGAFPKGLWARIVTSVFLAAAAIVLAVMPLPRGKSQSPSSGNLSEDHGQLRISWNATSQRVLTIVDGGERISLAIAASQSSLTYARRSGDVTVGIGSEQFRYIGPAPPPSQLQQARIQQERERVEALESRVTDLRVMLASGRTKLAKLESHSRYLTPH
ncbi:MAG TPA: hypothetical protein VK752_12640 [Bryobacteraceae bacterium]|jgi:hypothetical protein|nr:hypothetical protein [Bryobacteraceae bacterium]